MCAPCGRTDRNYITICVGNLSLILSSYFGLTVYSINKNVSININTAYKKLLLNTMIKFRGHFQHRRLRSSSVGATARVRPTLFKILTASTQATLTLSFVLYKYRTLFHYSYAINKWQTSIHLSVSLKEFKPNLISLQEFSLYCSFTRTRRRQAQTKSLLNIIHVNWTSVHWKFLTFTCNNREGPIPLGVAWISAASSSSSPLSREIGVRKQRAIMLSGDVTSQMYICYLPAGRSV